MTSQSLCNDTPIDISGYEKAAYAVCKRRITFLSRQNFDIV